MKTANAQVQRSPWAWVPSLYYAEGLPYFVVMSTAAVMFKNLGVGNTEIAFYTSLLGLIWALKPLWSPLAEMIGTLRGWVWVLQFAMAGALALLALGATQVQFFGFTLVVFTLLAVISASHDIAADGFYLKAQAVHQQAAFIGVRSTFYRAANITMQGALLVAFGELMTRLGDAQQAWSWLFWALSGLFALLAAWHFAMLPRPMQLRRADVAPVREFMQTFASYFRKPGIAVMLGFLLLYRFPEAQLLALAKPFLLDKPATGGLGLSVESLGLAYGTVGVLALTCGGLLGGWIVSRVGLKRALWPMVLAMHLPNLAFVYLAYAQPHDLGLISVALAVEQFGYGLGFTAYMMYMVMISRGDHQTAHYAICTGFMALGIGVPGMWSGWLQQQLGYFHFFGWVLVCTVPSLVMAALIKIPDNFGKKASA